MWWIFNIFYCDLFVCYFCSFQTEWELYFKRGDSYTTWKTLVKFWIGVCTELYITQFNILINFMLCHIYILPSINYFRSGCFNRFYQYTVQASIYPKWLIAFTQIRQCGEFSVFVSMLTPHARHIRNIIIICLCFDKI